MKLTRILLVLIVLAAVVVACAPAPTPAPPTATPKVTEAPKPTVAPPTAAPKPTEAPQPTAAPAAGGTLIGAFDVGPTGCPQCRPYDNTAGPTWLTKVWSVLTTYSSDFGKLEPSLATKWSANADFTKWTFNLRENVKWHDGKPFSAEDVKFSFQLAYNKDFGWRTEPGIKNNIVGMQDYIDGKAKEITGFKVVDPLTFEIALVKSDPRLPNKITNAFILPGHVLKDQELAKLAKSDWFLTSPVGTGPWKIFKYVKDQYMDLVPNELYWGGKPKLDHLINRYFADETSAAIAVEKGEIQFSYVPNDVAARLKTNPAFSIIETPSNVTNYILFNLRDKKLQDVRVRQAVWYAIDRNAIVKDVFKGTAYVPACTVPDQRLWPSDALPYGYNPDKARQLLKDANWNPNDSLEIWTYYTAQNQKDAMQAFQQYLAQVGMKVTLKFTDVPTYNASFYTGEGWTMSYRGIQLLYGDSGRLPFGTSEQTKDKKSWGGTDDPNFFKLIDAAEQAKTDEEYTKATQGVCGYLNKNAVEVAFWVQNRYAAVSTKVKNFVWVSTGILSYADKSEAWMISP